MPTALWDSQVRDVVFALQQKKSGNLSDPGTGKTAPSNVFMYYLWKEKGIKTIFVMPKKLFQQNKRSFLKYTDFSDEDVAIVRGTPKQRQKIMDTDAKVFLVTFSFFASSDYQYLKKVHPDINACVIDEFHMGFSSIESQRTQNWIVAMQRIEYLLVLTGTLIDGKLSSAYPFIHAVEPRYYFNYRDFLNQHALIDDWGKPYAWVNRDKVKAILEKHSIRHTFEEIHGEENIVVIPEVAEMEPAHRKIYKKFLETNMVELEREFKEMSSGGEAILRARQMLQCPEVFGNENIELGKDEFVLKHMIDAFENKKATIIFSTFVDEQKRLLKIAQENGIYARILNGSTSHKEMEMIDEEMLSGKLHIVIGTPACMSVGLDWNHLYSVVFCSMDFKDSNFMQGYRRGVRGKRDHALAIYILTYIDSVDERIMGKVEEKMALSADMQKGKKIINLMEKKDKSIW
jgi:ERCC4-related helicase